MAALPKDHRCVHYRSHASARHISAVCGMTESAMALPTQESQQALPVQLSALDVSGTSLAKFLHSGLLVCALVVYDITRIVARYKMAVLISENNVVSLRSAYVNDDGNLVGFRLDPPDLISLIPKGRKWWAPKDFDWVEQDSIWLYRHMRSAASEEELRHAFPCIEQDIKPLMFEESPAFKVVWADSGQSVALYLNEEPWAFIYEATHQGYSKGILKPAAAHLSPVGNQWDQDLFEKVFLN